MYQNRKSITEVERLVQLNKINNLMLEKKNFACSFFDRDDDALQILFIPKRNELYFDDIRFSYAHYNNFVIVMRSENGILLKEKFKLEDFVLCQE